MTRRAIHLNGTAVSAGRAEGTARVLRGPGDVDPVPLGCILVAHILHPHLSPLLFRLAGLVLEEGAVLQHATTLSREWGIPAVIGVKEAMSIIREGDRVRVDGGSGEILVVPAMDGG